MASSCFNLCIDMGPAEPITVYCTLRSSRRSSGSTSVQLVSTPIGGDYMYSSGAQVGWAAQTAPSNTSELPPQKLSLLMVHLKLSDCITLCNRLCCWQQDGPTMDLQQQ